MAALAPSSVFIVANAKPRARPVSRSITTLISFTGPCVESMARRSSSVTSKERFPTYSFELIIILGFFLCEVSGGLQERYSLMPHSELSWLGFGHCLEVVASGSSWRSHVIFLHLLQRDLDQVLVGVFADVHERDPVGDLLGDRGPVDVGVTETVARGVLPVIECVQLTP